MQTENLKKLEDIIFETFGKRVTVKYDGMQFYVAKKDNYKFGLGLFLGTACRFIRYTMTQAQAEELQK